MYSIAIDGPAGAGKSTIARAIARDMGFVYVDTGAMYRAMALYFLRHGIDGRDAERIAAECPSISVTIGYDGEGSQQVYLNGENVSALIREEEVGKMASVSSAIPAVREALLGLQRDMARTSDVLMDGRDIGTHVLPDATLKIFLTASPQVRARRRYDELVARGMECDYSTVLKDIIRRDRQDSEREIAPLRQAEDAVLIDTSDMDIGEVTREVSRLFEEVKRTRSHDDPGERAR